MRHYAASHAKSRRAHADGETNRKMSIMATFFYCAFILLARQMPIFSALDVARRSRLRPRDIFLKGWASFLNSDILRGGEFIASVIAVGDDYLPLKRFRCLTLH